MVHHWLLILSKRADETFLVRGRLARGKVCSFVALSQFEANSSPLCSKAGFYPLLTCIKHSPHAMP